MLPESSLWLTRFYFQRGLAGIYAVAFLIVVNQFRGLCGKSGLLPVDLFLKRAGFWDAPSLFWLGHSDGFMMLMAWLGLGLSLFAVSGYSENFGPSISVPVWLALWILYSSFVNVGQTFYSFGWEILLLESGFLAIFMGFSNGKSNWVLMLLLQWLLFRLMFGAGLIKLRGDECWRDLTCMNYHYETMPLPGPLSRPLSFLPPWIHKIEVLFNHLVEVVVPFFFFAPRPFCLTAGVVTILFQGFIILSGNFSWLNYIAIVIAFACFDDLFIADFFPRLSLWPKALGQSGPARDSVSVLPMWTIYGLAAIVGILSISPILNLLTSGQIMNTSFEPFHIVNTYGAFGSITRERNEIIIEGADHVDGPWKEYEFKAKPGRVSKWPPLVSPYHYKLDWQMWFAAMSSYRYHPWILNLVAKILQGNGDVLDLMARSPFSDHPPKFIRASLFRYHYAPLTQKNTWTRSYLGEYLPPLSLEDESFTDLLKAQGWLN